MIGMKEMYSSYIFFSRTINIIIITNIIEVMTIKMMLLIIITFHVIIVTNTKYFSLSVMSLSDFLEILRRNSD